MACWIQNLGIYLLTHSWATRRSTLVTSMEDTSRQNETNGAEDTADRPAVEMLRQGLRIWARVAVRSYMRKHPAASGQPEALADEDGGKG